MCRDRTVQADDFHLDQEAVNRLRSYVPPPTAYDQVPLSRRAAVLLLLYADRNGDLRVVVTIRAKTLSSCMFWLVQPCFQVPRCCAASHADCADPGLISRCRRGCAAWRYVSRGWKVPYGILYSHACLGRADTLAETPFQTARREAWEEIGLADIDHPLPPPFTVEHLCELPANLAKTELVVRPCVALLHSQDAQTGENADPEVSLIPKLDAREVAAVFTAPFADFLKLSSEDQDPGGWYRGSWSLWHNSNWRSRLISFRTLSFPCHPVIHPDIHPFPVLDG